MAVISRYIPKNLQLDVISVKLKFLRGLKVHKIQQCHCRLCFLFIWLERVCSTFSQLQPLRSYFFTILFGLSSNWSALLCLYNNTNNNNNNNVADHTFALTRRCRRVPNKVVFKCISYVIKQMWMLSYNFDILVNLLLSFWAKSVLQLCELDYPLWTDFQLVFIKCFFRFSLSIVRIFTSCDEVSLPRLDLHSSSEVRLVRDELPLAWKTDKSRQLQWGEVTFRF